MTGKRLETLYVWVATFADGGEGIISADIPLDLGQGQTVIRHTPLIHSDRATAEGLASTARRLREIAVAQAAARVIRVNLRSFHAALIESPIVGISWQGPKA